jgi:hypothetical protein
MGLRKRGKEMELNWLRGIGSGFDIAISVSLCAFIGYYICGGRLNGVTLPSILGLAIGAFFGLIIALYHLARIFGGGSG